MIRGMPDKKFSLLCLVASEKDRKRSYELPENVVEMEEAVLNCPDGHLEDSVKLPPGYIDKARDLHEAFPRSYEEASERMYEFMTDEFCAGVENHGAFRALFSKPAWDMVLQQYRDRGMGDCSFNAYYYTYLYIHFRIFRALRAELLPARVYHAVSTGYAGLLSVAASVKNRRPLILTEHGIYTNERNIEIIMADWLESAQRTRHISLDGSPGEIRRVWMRMFQFIGYLTYYRCRAITTLFGGNEKMQIAHGADPAKIRVIPNGVDVERLSSLPREPDFERPRISLVGRVVPIKDVRTYIKACAIVAREMPAARFELLGPTEEDPVYHEGCVQLVKQLGLESRFVFTGHVNLMDYFPTMSVCVLTSMSEGLPLVILETMACGIPQVASRVGACEELIMGREGEDERLGRAGFVTSVGAPEETARAILRVLGNRTEYERMARVARTRVRRFYDQNDVLQQYRELYDSMIERPDEAVVEGSMTRCPIPHGERDAGRV